jgi:hypothetical protein
MRGRVVATILLLAGCQVAATPNGDPAEPGEAAALQQAATSSQNVTVVNTASNPVPVSGTVAATQSGAWSMSLAPGGIVNIGNIPTVSLTPGTAVNVGTVLNPVSISSLPDVNIANLPPVSVANFPSTQAVSGTVAVSNLPPVSVANFPSTQAVSGTVAVANLPATQTVSGSVSVSNFPAAPTTQLLYTFDGMVSVELLSPLIDVAALKEVRVVASIGGSAESVVNVNSGGVHMEEFDTALAGTRAFSRAYSTPGTQLQVQVLANDGVSLRIYGRAN